MSYIQCISCHFSFKIGIKFKKINNFKYTYLDSIQ